MSEQLHNLAGMSDTSTTSNKVANKKDRQKVTIYAAGGGGTNLGHQLEQEGSSSCAAEYKVCYIDTSLSNIKYKDIDSKNYSVIEGVDGSGKVRKENVAVINESIGKILLKHQPEMLNIIVATGEGGSGSVIMPLLHKELLSRGEMVVSIMIGGEDSAISTMNTMNTIKSLDAVARSVGKPVVCSYVHNLPGKPRSVADSLVKSYVAALAILGSGMNDEMDTSDIRNFLDYSKVTDLDPTLVTLNITSDINEVTDDTVVAASIFKNKEHLLTLPVDTDYHTTMFNNFDLVTGDGNSPTGIFFTISLGMDEYYSELDRKVKSIEERKAARTKVRSISSNDKLDDSGIVV